jgi:hypothetical protein
MLFACVRCAVTPRITASSLTKTLWCRVAFFGIASVPARYEIIMIPPEPSQRMHSATAPER